MKRLTKIATERIPEWAMCYLFNGDTDCMNEQEVSMIDTFMNSYYNEFGAITLDVVDEEPSFTHYPAFGLPCDAHEVDVYCMQ